MTRSQVDFVTGGTVVERAPFVPEIRLQLATELTPLWQATADTLDDSQIDPPFWAFAWPGGQALARYVLDHPDTVRGRTVLDLGSGSGIVAIAAARSGAASVVANDTDPLALAAIGINAGHNDVTVATNGDNLTLAPPSERWDVILAGDVFYERAMATAIAAWLEAAAADGIMVLVSDPGRAYLPRRGITRIGVYEVPTSLELEDSQSRVTTIWSFTAPAPYSDSTVRRL